MRKYLKFLVLSISLFLLGSCKAKTSSLNNEELEKFKNDFKSISTESTNPNEITKQFVNKYKKFTIEFKSDEYTKIHGVNNHNSKKSTIDVDFEKCIILNKGLYIGESEDYETGKYTNNNDDKYYVENNKILVSNKDIINYELEFESNSLARETFINAYTGNLNLSRAYIDLDLFEVLNTFGVESIKIGDILNPEIINENYSNISYVKKGELYGVNYESNYMINNNSKYFSKGKDEIFCKDIFPVDVYYSLINSTNSSYTEKCISYKISFDEQ